MYRVAAILLAASLGLALWFNRDSLSPENIASWVRENVVGSGTGDGYPVTIGGSQIYALNFRSQSGDAVFVSDTHLTVLNSTGAEVISRQHSFDFPILCLSGDRALLYNLGGKGYQLESSRETVLRGTTEENILGGAIASNGHYALLTECADYLGQLTVYTEQNEKQFEYRFSSCYPAAAALNADATKALVGGVYAQDGGFASCLYLLDLNSSEAVSPPVPSRKTCRWTPFSTQTAPLRSWATRSRRWWTLPAPFPAMHTGAARSAPTRAGTDTRPFAFRPMRGHPAGALSFWGRTAVRSAPST